MEEACGKIKEDKARAGNREEGGVGEGMATREDGIRNKTKTRGT